MSALRSYWASHVRRRPFRLALAASSVALAVALYVSVDVSNVSVERSFRKSATRLAGNAQLRVLRSRAAGVEQEALAKIDATGVRAAPVVTASAVVAGESLLIVGVDFARESGFRRWDAEINPLAFVAGDAIVVTRAFAQRHGLSLGGGLDVETPRGKRRVLVGAIVPDEGVGSAFGGNVAAMALARVQKLFGREGRLDRVEILVDGDVGVAARRLREALGPEYRVEPPSESTSYLDEALGRLRAMFGVSAMAILVAAFIIYNAVSLSVVERVRELGTLRALGVTRGQILRSVLVEAALLGLAGSAAGVAAGWWLAGTFLDMTAREVNQVVRIVDPTSAVLLPRTVIAAVAFGVVATVAAAAAPALRATGVSPLDMFQRPTQVKRGGASPRACAVAGFAVLGVAGGLYFVHPLLSCLAGFVGLSLVLPVVAIAAARVSQPVLSAIFRVPGLLAADGLAKFPQRTALTVAALGGTLAMMVSAAAIITAFKRQGAAWMRDSFAFDVSVTPSDVSSGAYSPTTLDESWIAQVESVEGVASAYAVRAVLQDYRDRDVMVQAYDIAKYARGFVVPGLEGERSVVVSGNFATLHRVKAGDSIELVTPQGPVRFRVLSTYEDYTWPQGSVFMDRAVYRELWKDRGVSSINVRFKPGANPRAALVERLRPAGSVFLFNAADLQRASDDVLDRMLKFVNVQVAVAMIVGFLGIVSTLVISILQRSREIGLLRAVGLTRADVAAMVVGESLFVSLLGGVVGVAFGLAAAKWPLAAFVAQISGYAIPAAIPWGTMAIAMGVTVPLGLLASIVPARRAAGLNVLEAVRYE